VNPDSNERDLLREPASRSRIVRAPLRPASCDELLAAEKDLKRGAFLGQSPPECSDRAGERDGEAGEGDGLFATQHNTSGRGLLLVVEDEPDDFVLLERAAIQAGVNARTQWARSVPEALHALAKVGPDINCICVVSDIRLPGEDGFEFLRKVRLGRFNRPVRFAFLTGHSDQPVKERAHACGADAFFVKPLRFAELVQVACALQQLLTL
jgi:CheY-like chemotaxis protein